MSDIIQSSLQKIYILIESIQKKIDIIQEKLLIIEEKKTDYFFKNDIPLTLIQEEKYNNKKLDVLRSDLEQLRNVEKELKYTPSIPATLLYSIDRDLQKSELNKKLKNLDWQAPRHFVFIIPGNEYQSHHEFLKYLKDDYLPWLLKLRPKQDAIKDLFLEWPTGLQNVNDLHEQLRQKIARAVFAESNDTPQEINQQLAGYRIIMLRIQFFTEDWQKHKSKVIESFLQFCQNWPSLKPKHCLIAFLIFKYRSEERLGFFERQCIKYWNRKINKYFKTLSFSKYDRIIGTALTELKGIHERNVDDWAHKDDIKNWIKNQRLVDDIRDIFARWKREKSSQEIPMEFLADELSVILAKDIIKEIVDKYNISSILEEEPR